MLDYRLRGDSHHLRQVLLNLLGNAIKFTERGEVTIAVEQVKESAEGVTARFEVRDTGIGISTDALGRIFERFAQADDSMTRRYGGSGLGTTIAKQLVELMGGTIGVKSKLGEGSTFWIELPLLKDVAVGRSPDRDNRPTTKSRCSSATPATSPRSDRWSRPSGADLKFCHLPPRSAPRIQAILDAGASIRAIVVAASVDAACTAFTAAAQRLGERPVALIHIAQEPLSVVDTARVRSIRDAVTSDQASFRAHSLMLSMRPPPATAAKARKSSTSPMF